eukprot:354230-Chlamydomonas_euryale.AAC.10
MWLSPTTSPSRLTSGPPELPWLIAASLWMKPVRAAARPSSTPRRSTQLTTPAVTEWRSVRGLPSATTQAPVASSALVPNVAAGSGSPDSICGRRVPGGAGCRMRSFAR